MAYMKPIKKKSGLTHWYSRIESVRWTQPIYISLETNSKTTARVRHSMVEKVEDDIKKGNNFVFPWQKEDGGKTAINLIYFFGNFS